MQEARAHPPEAASARWLAMPRVKRPVAVAVGCALLAGVAFGAAVVSASEAPSAARAHAATEFQVVSRWSGPPFQGARNPVRLLSGSLQNDPGRGFVLVQTVGMRPGFFATPEKTGALRLVSGSGSPWVLRAANGSLVLAYAGAPSMGVPPTFDFLGPRLDPDKLGPIGARGVAVAYAYGPYTRHGEQEHNDVVLVERTEGRRGPGWKIYGYLAGYTLPRVAAEAKLVRQLLGTTQELRQPLLGPNGRLYTIDAKKQRLVPGTWRGAARGFKFGSCTTWPARSGASYLACPNSIVLRKGRGPATTLLRRNLGKLGSLARSWIFVQPSPNGKWLLTQDAFGACGLATWAYFLPARGGSLVSAFPGSYTSEALGWLPDNTALVAAQSLGCEGPQTNGIYQVWPGNPVFEPAPQLVFQGSVFDATTWGFGGKSAR